MFTFFLRKLGLWFTKKWRHQLPRIALANLFSIIIYTIAEGYSLGHDAGSSPLFIQAFILCIVPQSIWLAYDLGYYRASKKIDAT
jgi:hypothetical protein